MKQFYSITHFLKKNTGKRKSWLIKPVWILFLSTFLSFGLVMTAGAQCVINQTADCPVIIPLCENTSSGGLFGAIVNFDPPEFELNCGGGGTGYDFVMKFDLPESQSGCWIYNKVQRVGNDGGQLRLYQSTGTPPPTFTTPSFVLTGPTEYSVLIFADHSFTMNIYLINSSNEKSGILATNNITAAAGTQTVSGTIPFPLPDGVYRLFFEFTGMNQQTASYIDDLSIDAMLYGDACSGDINFHTDVTVSPALPNGAFLDPTGTFFPVGKHTVTYTAYYTTSASTTTDFCSFDVTVNPAVKGSASVTTPISCNAGTGTVTLTQTSGTAPFSYTFNSVTNSTGIFTGITSGTGYAWSISDVNNCGTASGTINVNQPTALSASITAQTNVLCYGNSTGAATVTAAGGTGPYSYSWAPSGGSGATANGLAAATYTVTVTDANQCPVTATATITQPASGLTANAVSVNSTCGKANGSVNLTVGGGAGSYNYSWSNGANTEDLSNVAAGSYTVTVTDGNGCTVSTSVTVNDTGGPGASITAQTNVLCYGNNTGAATVTATGGTSPYTYSWLPSGGSAATATGLTAGSYTVTVTDANQCTTTATATITQPAARLSATITAQTNVLCYGNSTGAATVTAGGGTGPYSYSWAPSGGSAATENGLAAGSYTVTVTDVNKCTATATATITQPAALSATITAQTNVLCYGNSTGAATVTAEGGTGPYSYFWTPSGGSAATATGLTAGSYTVNVTDANQCPAKATAIITQPASGLTANAVSVNSTCGKANGSVNLTVGGGAGSYSYSWSNGAITEDLSNVAAGSYTVTVTDGNGCTVSTSATVNDTGGPGASITAQTNVLCYGGNTGAATVTATGGTGPYSYSWAPSGGSGSTATGLTSGSYTVTVTDANQCITAATATITQPAAELSATITAQTNVLCYGGNTGAATVTAEGGTGPYSYSWAPSGGSAATENGLAAGSYIVTVTDANKCTATATATISQPQSALSATAAASHLTCNSGVTDLAVTAVGGTAPYEYSLDNSPYSSANTFSVGPGTYTIHVRDHNGCEFTINRFAIQEVCLTITKESAESSYDALADVLHYTIVVTNTGNVTLNNVIVTDQLTGLNQTIATLLPGAANAVTINTTYDIKQTDLDNKKVDNTAHATFTFNNAPYDLAASESVPLSNLPPVIFCPNPVVVKDCEKTVSGLQASIADLNNNIVSLTWTMTGATTASSPATGINNLDSYTFEQGVTTITYIVTDAYQLSSSCSFTVTIEAGTFTMPQNTSEIVACAGDIVAPKPPEVKDACGNPIIPVAGKAPVVPACEGEMIYSWIYTDKDKKSYTWTHTVTIKYKPLAPIKPTFSTIACVKDIWDGILPALPIVTDNCGNVLIPTGPAKSNLPVCEGTKTWTWTYTDCVGNKQEYVHTVTIEMPPLAPITPTYGTVECVNQIWDGIVPKLPVVTDACGNILAPKGPAKSNLPKCSGTKTWTWTYTDCAGHTQDYVHTVEVIPQPFKEITPTSASFACPADIKLPLLPLVKDKCGNILSPAGPVITMLKDCTGSRTYTWTYTDCAGNKRDYLHTVTIKPPKPFGAITPTFSTVVCKDDIWDGNLPPLPVVMDACGNILTPTGPDKSSIPECEGTKTWTWTYTDCAGNTQKYIHTVTVEMEPFPEIAPTYATFTCEKDIVMPVLPLVKDNCGNILNPAGPVSTVQPGCKGSQKLVWTYTDCEGNKREYVHTVTISPQPFGDITPTFAKVACVDDIVEPVPPVITDYCGNLITPSGPAKSSKPECNGTKTFTWTYKDCSGISRDYVHTVEIESKPFPAIASTSATVESAMDIVMPVLPVVTDNCGRVLSPTGPVVSPMPDCEGDVTYTWTYEDCSGNTQEYVHLITIKGCVPLNHCTYTQGFYGNTKGKNCAYIDNAYVSADALTMMKAAFGDNAFILFGTESGSKYFKLMKESLTTSTTPEGIFQMLPGGGTPAALIGSATSLDEMSKWGNVPRSVQTGSLGKIKNNLLSQTITLFFNLGNDKTLGEVRLRGTYMITEKSSECGSLAAVPNSGLYTEIPQSVLDYFTANNLEGTVKDLFDLANLVLGGEIISPSVSAGDVTSAVDAINVGFDECRILVKFTTTKPDVPKASSTTYEIGKRTDGLSGETTEVVLTVYPNPFKSIVRFQLDMVYDSNVKVEIYSQSGQLLKIIFNEDLKQGDVETAEFDASMYAHSAFHYKVVTNNTIRSGTIVKIK